MPVDADARADRVRASSSASFLFGVGMQLGGSCASGTLFAIGSGQTAILLTLVGFIGGATLGAYHFPWWTNELPAHAPVSLTDWSAGYPGAWRSRWP